MSIIWDSALDVWYEIPPTPEKTQRENERMRSRARHNEAAALRHARVEGAEAEREKWQGVVAEKNAALSEKNALIAELQAKLEGRS